jgi:hypothetical protein
LDALKAKISRIEMNKFSNSSILDNVTYDIQSIFTETQTSITQQNGTITKTFTPSIPDITGNSGVRVDVGGINVNAQVFANQGIIGTTTSNVDLRGITSNFSDNKQINISTTTNNVQTGGNSSTLQYGYVSGGEARTNQSGTGIRNTIQVGGYQSGSEARNINVTGYQSGSEVRNINVTGYKSGSEVRNNAQVGYQTGSEIRNNIQYGGYQSGSDIRNTINSTGVSVNNNLGGSNVQITRQQTITQINSNNKYN